MKRTRAQPIREAGMMVSSAWRRLKTSSGACHRRRMQRRCSLGTSLARPNVLTFHNPTAPIRPRLLRSLYLLQYSAIKFDHLADHGDQWNDELSHSIQKVQKWSAQVKC